MSVGLLTWMSCCALRVYCLCVLVGKGKIQHVLKQYHKALSTFDSALAIEAGNTEVLEAKRATMIAIQSTDADPERAKQAMQDPEIQAILRDPTISKVLADLQSNPAAGQAAMRDPDIRSKIEKLIAGQQRTHRGEQAHETLRAGTHVWCAYLVCGVAGVLGVK